MPFSWDLTGEKEAAWGKLGNSIPGITLFILPCGPAKQAFQRKEHISQQKTLSSKTLNNLPKAPTNVPIREETGTMTHDNQAKALSLINSPRPGSPVPSTPERREWLRTCYWEGPSQLPERRSSSSAPRRGSAEPRPRGCSGLGEPRPALPSF